MPNRVQNLLADLPDASSEETIEVLLSMPTGRLERIVSRGQATPGGFWYDQSQAEWVMLLSGHARLTIEEDNTDYELRPGDSMYLPAHCRHRVSWTDPQQETVWLALFVDTNGSDVQHNSLAQD